MLFRSVPLERVAFPCYAELKYDGVRLFISHEDNKITFRTFNGKFVHLPATAERIARQLNKGSGNWVLDCEVTVHGGKQVMRSVVTGLINSAIRNKSIDEDKLEFNVFDYLTLEEFTSFICTKTYLVRRFTAAVCVNSLSLPQLTLAKQYAVRSEERRVGKECRL